MSTALHSEQSELLNNRRPSAARLQALAARQLPVALSLGAVILSVLGVRL